MADKLYISKITLPNGNTYDIKDTDAARDSEFKALEAKVVTATSEEIASLFAED